MDSKFLTRKFRYKITAGILVTVFVIGLIVLLATDSELFHLIGTQLGVKILFFMLWASLVYTTVSFIYDTIMIKQARREYKELEYKLYSDISSGIANRYYCDIIIDKYVDEKLPADVSCAILSISNIQEINEKYGRKTGTKIIVEFSKMLVSASKDICFVGRNSGNQFLAIFEHTGPEKVKEFGRKLEALVKEHNEDPSVPEIRYVSGIAENRKEKTDSIIKLVSLADDRALDSQLEDIILV